MSIGEGIYYKGLIRSLDAGKTWQKIAPSALDSARWIQLVEFRNQPYAWTNTGLFRSYDSGLTWVRLPNNNLPQYFSISQPVAWQDKALVVTCESGSDRYTLITQDSGDSWSEIGHKQTLIPHSNMLVELTNDALYRTTDQGNTRTKIVEGLPSSLEIRYVASEGDRIYISTTSHGFFVSLDKGKTWSQPSSLAHDFIKSITVLGNVVIAPTGTLNKHFVSEDGGTTWRQMDTHIPTSFDEGFFFAQLGSLYYLPRQEFILNGSTQYLHLRLFQSQDGKNWSQISSIDTAAMEEYKTLFFIGTSLYVVVETTTDKRVKLLMSSNGGTSWTTIDNEQPGTQYVSLGERVYKIVYNDNFTYQSFQLDKQSSQWQELPTSHGLHGVTSISNIIRAGAVIYALIDKRYIHAPMRSIDQGLSWVSSHHGLVGGSNCMSVSGSTVFLGTATGLYRVSE